MKIILDSIADLKNADSAGMTTDECCGYIKACNDIGAKINVIMKDRGARAKMSNELFKIGMREDLREIIRRRFS